MVGSVMAGEEVGFGPRVGVGVFKERVGLGPIGVTSKFVLY